jgi:hypothetical protein
MFKQALAMRSASASARSFASPDVRSDGPTLHRLVTVGKRIRIRTLVESAFAQEKEHGSALIEREFQCVSQGHRAGAANHPIENQSLNRRVTQPRAPGAFVPLRN